MAKELERQKQCKNTFLYCKKASQKSPKYHKYSQLTFSVVF